MPTSSQDRHYKMETVQSDFPHRDCQIGLLWKLFHNHKNVSEMVHVFGLPGTGKTAIIRSVLKMSRTLHIYINCHECSSARSLFERILSDIGSDSQLDPSSFDLAPAPEKRRSKAKPALDCQNSGQFVERYNDLCAWKFGRSKLPIVAVLDNFERVQRYSDGSPLLVLRRVSEYSYSESDRNKPNRLVLITVSDRPWSRLFSGGRYSCAGAAPIQVAFQSYSIEQVIDVLAKMKADDGSNDARYWEFLKHMVDIFSSSCRDVLELEYQIRPLWVASGGKRITETSVWNRTRKSAASKLKTLFLRNSNSTCEMSQTSKYLLVAAYCASYNPQRADKLFFLKHHGKEKVQTPHSKRKSAFRQQCLLTGPKAFPLERLLTIYRCLAKENDKLLEAGGANVTDGLLSQIASLVSDRLLQLVSAQNMLDTPKYRCLASLEIADEIAKSVGIELKQRLFDLVNAA